MREHATGAVKKAEPSSPSASSLPVERSPRSIQRKSNGASQDDPLERDADRTADRLVQEARSAERDPRKDRRLGPNERFAQRAATPGAVPSGTRERGGGVSPSGSGVPLPAAERDFFGPRLGFDFSRVRLFADETAAVSAAGMRARAYTTGSDIVFGSGQYAPATQEGRWLLAHELTHVVQQADGARRAEEVQRTPADAAEEPAASTPERPTTAEPAAAPSGLIVEDDTSQIAPGAMRKSEFLDQLNAAVCAAAESALSGTIWSAAGCPWIDRWFGYYRGRSGPEIERATRRYAPQAAAATSARDYIPIITDRVRVGIATWQTTGETPAPPEGAPDIGAENGGGILSGVASAMGGLSSSLEGMLFKAREGGAAPAGADPGSIASRLGQGTGLGADMATKMSAAFGEDFSQVKVHADTAAAAISDQLNARAFTVGSHIAFGAGEYRPGTPVGDAILAHELAHVVQQRGASAVASPSASVGALEGDADHAAAGAMMSLWGGRAGVGARRHSRAAARARSGISLQRCGRSGGGSGSVSGSTTPATPTMTVSGDSYDDSGGARYSAKNIKFTVDVPAGGDVHDWALVNWLKGSDKHADGTPYKVQMYGSWVDYSFASFQVDSVDADPVYWSDGAARWNYVAAGSNGFYATDSPGPQDHKWDAGEQVDLSFKMGLYKLADLPLTTTGDVGTATAVQEIPWTMKVDCDAAGNITH